MRKMINNLMWHILEKRRNKLIPDAFFNAGFYYMKQHKYREAKDAFETYVALTCDVSDDELGENGVYKKAAAGSYKVMHEGNYNPIFKLYDAMP